MCSEMTKSLSKGARYIEKCRMKQIIIVKQNKTKQTITTYRTSKGWNIIEIQESFISIHIADRQSQIITAKTHKLYRMTNFFEG